MARDFWSVTARVFIIGAIGGFAALCLQGFFYLDLKVQASDDKNVIAHTIMTDKIKHSEDTLRQELIQVVKDFNTEQTSLKREINDNFQKVFVTLAERR